MFNVKDKSVGVPPNSQTADLAAHIAAVAAHHAAHPADQAPVVAAAPTAAQVGHPVSLWMTQYPR